MKNTIYKLLIILFSVATYPVSAQISFVNRSDLLSGPENFSGVAMGIIDMNQDGLDDVVRMNIGQYVNLQLQGVPTGTFSSVDNLDLDSGTQWNICMADIDNNGTNEILSGGFNGAIFLIQRDSNGMLVNELLVDTKDVFAQGSNFVDINNDGFVDIFVCHDNGESRIWGNIGDGTFEPRDEWIDMSVDGSSGEAASGNYGSTWTDIDNDGDLDLYIAKCRQGVTNVDDKRRINQLYLNDGTGHFLEAAETVGLAIGWQSWTADFQDINNDGLLDCFITNHDHPSQLFLNDGSGNFFELENTGIEIFGLPMQGLMVDMDNDGWVDIVTTGSKGQVFRNNGDLTFTEINDIFDSDALESLAIGDLNNDGYLDIYGGYARIFNTPSDIPDKLWLNGGGDNNFVKIQLTGEESNRNAIGTRIELYGDWGKQIREVRAGESYGIANSLTMHFGLGQAQEIDSVVVRWPSGFIQTETALTVNTTVRIKEGKCLAKAPNIELSGPQIFCGGDSLVLMGESDYVSYEWTDGSPLPSITVDTTGNYQLQVVDENGCVGQSEVISVLVDPQLSPTLQSKAENGFCEGSTLDLEVIHIDVEEEDILWSNGDLGYRITIENGGDYQVTVTSVCQEFESNVVSIVRYDLPDIPNAKGDTIQLGDIAQLSAEGDNLAWFANEFDDFPFAFGQAVEVAKITSDTSFYVEDRGGPGQSDKVGMSESDGSYEENLGINYSLRFNALQTFTLHSVKVYTDLPGIRTITIKNSSFQEVYKKQVDLPIGESRVRLDAEIPKGDSYYIGTDIIQDKKTTGELGPRLQISTENVAFPYVLEDIVEITRSNSTNLKYYYFFDWEVSSGLFCPSERAEVNVWLDNMVSAQEHSSQGFQLFPNPTKDRFKLKMHGIGKIPVAYHVVNSTGGIIQHGKIAGQEMAFDATHWSPGIYFLKLLNGNDVYIQKIIIQ